MDDMSHLEIRNQNLWATIETLGATLFRLRVKTDDGWRDVVLSSLDDPYIGRSIGRYASRLAKGRFELDGTTYQVTINEPPNSLHGGSHGFSDCEWTVISVDETSVVMQLISPDGDQGYPGQMETVVVFDLGENALTLTYAATCDQPTIVNLTSHPYFNLGLEPTIDDHRLWVNSTEMTPLAADLIPTGQIEPVSGTDYDFTTPKTLGPALEAIGVLDDCFMVAGVGLRPMVRLSAPDGLTLAVLSDAPAVVIYDAAGFTGEAKGPDGQAYGRHAGLAIEPKYPPDSPNQPDFPDPVLRPGQTWSRTISFVIGVFKD